MKTFVPILALAFALIAVPANAAECVPTTSEPEIDSTRDLSLGLQMPDEAPRFYVDNDMCQPCHGTIWIYQESNGIDGLQRNDEFHDDTCGGAIQSDTIIF